MDFRFALIFLLGVFLTVAIGIAILAAVGAVAWMLFGFEVAAVVTAGVLLLALAGIGLHCSPLDDGGEYE